MNCLPCFSKDEEDESADHQTAANRKETPGQVDTLKDATSSSNAQTFTFRELAMATKNFRQECLLGEGGFGRVYKGKLQSTGQVVAVKQLDRNGMQPNKEFLVEVMMLSLLQHVNLVSLIGYCADGDQRLLVYEYMPMGSLEDHLFGDKKTMDWYTRMKIASGAAIGLEYLHEKANPPIIYRDLKPSNILLDESYEPKLSDFGLAKLGAGGGKINPTSRVMGTYGYSAPEYSSSGELTLKSDIYSFGVVLLELITGRKAIDTTRPNNEQNLVTWAQPIFREPKRFPEMADPRLNNEFPVTSLNQAVGIAAMCLQEEASVRPLIGDVVAALSFLAMPQPNIPASIPTGQEDSVTTSCTPPPEQKMQYGNKDNQNQPTEPDNNTSNHDDSSSESSEYDEESDEENEENSRNSSVGESCNNTEDVRQSVDHQSEEESSYSDDDDNHDDVDRSNSTNSDISKSEVGNLSSNSGHENSQRSSPTKRTGSRRRKMVVTFKEPNLSTRRNRSKKVDDESNSSHHQQSSSSSSESSSESEDDKGSSSRHQNEAHEKKRSVSHNQGFDKSDKESSPKLRHIQTR